MQFFKYLNSLVAKLKLLLNFKTEENFLFFKYKLINDEELKLELGMVFGYNDIEFYIKGFTSSETKKIYKLDNFSYKLNVVCEYFDIDKKEFIEKILPEDFVKYRVKVWQAIIKSKE